MGGIYYLCDGKPWELRSAFQRENTYYSLFQKKFRWCMCWRGYGKVRHTSSLLNFHENFHDFTDILKCQRWKVEGMIFFSYPSFLRQNFLTIFSPKQLYYPINKRVIRQIISYIVAITYNWNVSKIMKIHTVV